MGPDAIILVFECWVLSQLFQFPLSPSSRGSLVPLYFLPLQWYHPYIWCCWCFSCISQFTSVQCNCSVVSDSLWPHGLQHTRIPCSSPTPGAYSNSCPSSRWCHPTISSCVNALSSGLQSFPASGSFPVSQFFTLGGQSIGASASAPVLPMNIQNWFPSSLTGLVSLQSKGLSRVFSNTTVQKHQFFGTQLSL